MWMRITDKIGRKNFKYRDYYGSLSIKNYQTLEPYILKELKSVNDLISLIEKYPNPSFPINTKHIIEICPFIYN